MSVHSCIQTAFRIFLKGIGSHGNDGDCLCALLVHGTDGSGGGKAIHDRHPQGALLQSPRSIHYPLPEAV